jgi:hypothetical protein
MVMNHVSEGPRVTGTTVTAAVSVQGLAEETENPDLFLEKYTFYVEELGFTPQQAVRWASRTVKVDTQVRRAFRLKD